MDGRDRAASGDLQGRSEVGRCLEQSPEHAAEGDVGNTTAGMQEVGQCRQPTRMWGGRVTQEQLPRAIAELPRTPAEGNAGSD
jgi:hypothetical protein